MQRPVKVIETGSTHVAGVLDVIDLSVNARLCSIQNVRTDDEYEEGCFLVQQ